MAHPDQRSLDARPPGRGGAEPARARRVGKRRRRRGCVGSSLVAAAALAALATLLGRGLGGAQAQTTDCLNTACKPGFANVGDTIATASCTACSAGTPACQSGCVECCAKAGYSCANAQCSPGHTKKTGFVDVCTRCPLVGEDTCSNTAAAVGCSECCEPLGCSATTVCAFGYVNTNASPSPTPGGCDGTTCRSGAAAAAACCVPAKSVFPTCAASVPPAGLQALSTSDVSWAFRSTGGFTRFKGKMTGLCFSINLRNDCSGGASDLQSACCLSAKQPAFLQVKFAHPDALAGINGAESRVATLKSIDRCRLSYGLATATVNGIKRFPRVVEVAAAGSNPGSKASRVYNIPLSLSSSAQSVEFCLFTNSAQSVDAEGGVVNCSWEHICGLDDGSVPSPASTDPADKDRSLGCQFRLIGRADTRVSAPCCTAPMTLTSYDGTHESAASVSSNTPSGRRRLFI